MSNENIFSVFAVVMDANGQRNLEFVIKEQCQMGLHQQLLLPINKIKNHDAKNENKKD